MATKLNVGKDTRKIYKQAREEYKEAIIATDVQSKDIIVAYRDKLEKAQKSIGEAIGATESMLKMLEKDSNKRSDYEKIHAELSNMYEQTEKWNGL